MITRIKNGNLIIGDEIISGKYLYFEDGRITNISDAELKFDEEIDANGKYVSAGFIDVHVHGGAGYEFVDATEEAILAAANIHAPFLLMITTKQ